jgi:hypothetical protein
MPHTHYDRHLASELEKEEATMEAADVFQSMVDEAVKTELFYWYNSEPDFFEYFKEMVHENKGIVRSLYLQMRAKDVPALKSLDESYTAWCEERCREAVIDRLKRG